MENIAAFASTVLLNEFHILLRQLMGACWIVIARTSMWWIKIKSLHFLHYLLWYDKSVEAGRPPQPSFFPSASSIRPQAGKGLAWSVRQHAWVLRCNSSEPAICRCSSTGRAAKTMVSACSSQASGDAPKATEHPPALRDVRWATSRFHRVDACVPT